MRYFLDSEFIERFHRPLIGRAYHVIDLISIALVDESGREYYAISNEFKFKHTTPWLRDNVLVPLVQHEIDEDAEVIKANLQNYVQHVQSVQGKSLEQIADEIFQFCSPGLPLREDLADFDGISAERLRTALLQHDAKLIDGHYVARPSFYTYYGAYDWVLFCSLFGKLIHLPKGFPKIHTDLKQSMTQFGIGNIIPKSARHHALCDARWNKSLYHEMERECRHLNLPFLV
jgi:hypothetical protein